MSDVLFEAQYTGPLPRINEKFGACVVCGSARLYNSASYRKKVESIVWSFRVAVDRPPIDFPVDAELVFVLSKRTDSDACVKGVLDALEKAGVVANDRLIRNIRIERRYKAQRASDRVGVRLLLVGGQQ